LEAHNSTKVSEFCLLGLLDDAELQAIVFELFICIYLVSLFGNLHIILAIGSDPQLQILMYFSSPCV
jgi:olfactory receptor